MPTESDASFVEGFVEPACVEVMEGRKDFRLEFVRGVFGARDGGTGGFLTRGVGEDGAQFGFREVRDGADAAAEADGLSDEREALDVRFGVDAVSAWGTGGGEEVVPSLPGSDDEGGEPSPLCDGSNGDAGGHGE